MDEGEHSETRNQQNFSIHCEEYTIWGKQTAPETILIYALV